MKYISEIYQTPAKDYMKQAVKQNSSVYLIIMSIITAGVIILSFFDLRWAFVGLILLFLIFPTMIFNAYFFNLLTPEARKALSPKTIEFLGDDGMNLRYFRKNADDEWEPTGMEEKIDGEEIRSVTIGEKEVLVRFKTGKPGFLIVNKAALDKETVNMLYDKYVNSKNDSY